MTTGTGPGAGPGGGRAPDLAVLDLCDLDLFSAGFPDEVFATLRREAPVWWQAPTARTPGGVGFWVVSRHADVVAGADDAATFSSERAPGASGGGTLIQDLPWGAAAGVLLNMTDDPRHRQVRRLLTPAMAPRALAALEPVLRGRARRIVAAVTERGACDFLTDVAVELPIQALAGLLGVPEEDRHDLLAWATTTLDHEGRELGESTGAVDRAAAALAAYGGALVAERRARPGDDLLSAAVLGGAGSGRALDDLELLMLFNLLVVAGSETTRNAIALGLVALVEHPDQLADLRDDRSLMGTAVEEILRWTTATLYNRRTATRDAALAGTPIAAGDKVTLWWASANRDEAVFADPFRFDVRRHPNPHVSFGHRSHVCLGAALARLEIRCVLDEVLDRWDDLALAGPVTRVRTHKHAGVSHVPLTFRPR